LCGKVFAQESLEGGLVVVFAAGGWKVDGQAGAGGVLKEGLQTTWVAGRAG
jgi:hypothetical protein